MSLLQNIVSFIGLFCKKTYVFEEHTYHRHSYLTIGASRTKNRFKYAVGVWGWARLTRTLQRTATHCNALECTAATHCNALQRTATPCNALECTAATHCNGSSHSLCFSRRGRVSIHPLCWMRVSCVWWDSQLVSWMG